MVRPPPGLQSVLLLQVQRFERILLVYHRQRVHEPLTRRLDKRRAVSFGAQPGILVQQGLGNMHRVPLASHLVAAIVSLTAQGKALQNGASPPATIPAEARSAWE